MKQKERAESILAKPEHERAEEETSFLRTYQDRKKEKAYFNRDQRQNKRNTIRRILTKPVGTMEGVGGLRNPGLHVAGESLLSGSDVRTSYKC